MNPPRIIHNPKNLDRHFSVLEQLSSQGIEEYTFEDAVMNKKDPTKGVSEAHCNIIRKYYDEPEITIFEDDIIFTQPNSWEKYWEWYEELPKDWSVYMGGCYLFKRKESVSENLEQLRGYVFTGFHWYTVKKPFYDIFLRAKEGDHIDRYVASTGAKTYVPKLLPSRQAETTIEPWATSERKGNAKTNYTKIRAKHKYL